MTWLLNKIYLKKTQEIFNKYRKEVFQCNYCLYLIWGIYWSLPMGWTGNEFVVMVATKKRPRC